MIESLENRNLLSANNENGYIECKLMTLGNGFIVGGITAGALHLMDKHTTEKCPRNLNIVLSLTMSLFAVVMTVSKTEICQGYLEN